MRSFSRRWRIPARRLASAPAALGALVVLALVCSACPAPTPVGTGRQINTNPTAERLTQNVVLVIIDGLRYSEGLGDPDHVYVPRMAELAGWGARVDPFLNNGVTVTRRGIPAIWCGTWDAPVLFDDPACGGSTNQRTVAPSIFEYYRKSLDRPADDCVYVLGSVLCPWRQSLHPDYGETYWPRVDQVGDNDIGNWEQARAVLQNDKPHFLLLYLPDVDHFGHYGDWPGYTRAIAVADSIVGMLWDTLQADPQYAGRTTLFVTNDHGRHNNRPDEPHDGFSGHGDDCAGCRRIELLAVGPDIRPGFRSTTPRNIPDIAPTIGALLGFPTPFVTGSVMTEILTDAPPGE